MKRKAKVAPKKLPPPKYKFGGLDSIVNGAKNMLVADADIALSTLGMSNVIKPDSYSGDSAKFFNQAGNIGGAITKTAAPIVATAFGGPMAGAAVSGLQQVGGAFNPQDPNQIQAKLGGKIPNLYSLGGKQTIQQFDGPSHEQGGIPLTNPNGQPFEVEKQEVVSEEPNGDMKILSDNNKLKLPSTGKNPAQSHKPFMTWLDTTNKKLDKMKNPSKELKTSAELTELAVNKAKDILYNEQEALKALKVAAYAKKMGFKMPGTTQPTEARNGGMYTLGGKDDFSSYNNNNSMLAANNSQVYNIPYTQEDINNNANNINNNTLSFINPKLGQSSNVLPVVNTPSPINPNKPNFNMFTNVGNSYSDPSLQNNFTTQQPEDIKLNRKLTPLANAYQKANQPPLLSNTQKDNLGNAAFFGANMLQRAGTLAQLKNEGKNFRKEDYGTMNRVVLDPTADINAANSNARIARENAASASGGQGANFLANNAGVMSANTLDRNRIGLNYANAQASLDQNVNATNYNGRMQGIINTGLNEDVAKGRYYDALDQIGSTAANSARTVRENTIDKQKMDVIYKNYNNPKFQQFLKENGYIK